MQNVFWKMPEEFLDTFTPPFLFRYIGIFIIFYLLRVLI